MHYSELRTETIYLINNEIFKQTKKNDLKNKKMNHLHDVNRYKFKTKILTFHKK